MLVLGGTTKANNVKIHSLEVSQGREIAIVLSWENSWNNTNFAISQQLPPNHDAVWLFFKYRLPSQSCFRHLNLDTNSKNYRHSTNVSIRPVPTGTGLLVIPELGVRGTLEQVSISFAIPSFLENQTFELEAHAIE
ncbi:MAG: hypothetical protein RML72_00410, partial [Bacteroidia bacterium]|nr:hypothetical protein [Bacteroidia bacterium]MDW8157328.1 hypothetical protein [Bacteroidia bacterium]